jgi:hypothetical protein
MQGRMEQRGMSGCVYTLCVLIGTGKLIVGPRRPGGVGVCGS